MTALDMFRERQKELGLLFAAVKLAGVFHVKPHFHVLAMMQS